MNIKRTLVNKILAHLNQELSNATEAAHNAHLAATDDQSVAETQYDTLAIEASYLAEGQSRRVDEIKHAIELYQQIKITEPPNISSVIALTSLVQLAQDELANQWFFIGPASAGFTCKIQSKHITVITPHSPMGRALLDKLEDDDITLKVGAKQLNDYILRVE